jgi:predicted nucleic acid-binding protein
VIVVDTNVLLYFWLRTEKAREAERLYAKDPDWIAPMLWRSEFRNSLLLNVRKERMSFEQAMYAVASAEEQMADNEHIVDFRSVMRLATDSGCSAYDCEFVALAEVTGLPLITSDRRILERFPKIAQPLPDFIH